MYMVTRQQRINFWSQRILGIKQNWKNPFSNNQNIKTYKSNCRILKSPSWSLRHEPQKIIVPSSIENS